MPLTLDVTLLLSFLTEGEIGEYLEAVLLVLLTYCGLPQKGLNTRCLSTDFIAQPLVFANAAV